MFLTVLEQLFTKVKFLVTTATEFNEWSEIEDLNKPVKFPIENVVDEDMKSLTEGGCGKVSQTCWGWLMLEWFLS